MDLHQEAILCERKLGRHPGSTYKNSRIRKWAKMKDNPIEDMKTLKDF